MSEDAVIDHATTKASSKKEPGNMQLTDDELSAIDWDSLSDTQLDVLERQIAGKYMHRVPWGAVVWAFGNLFIWLSLWPLLLLGYIPLWLTLIIASWEGR